MNVHIPQTGNEELAGGVDGPSILRWRRFMGPPHILNAPRGKVLKVPVARPQLASAQTVVPESQAAIERVVSAANFLIDSESRFRSAVEQF